MALFSFLNKNRNPILMRCTQCYYEFDLSTKEVLLLELLNDHAPVCPVKELCDICHIGFMIPVNYTNKNGTSYLFHEIKPKIKNLDPNTVLGRIFQDPNPFFDSFD